MGDEMLGFQAGSIWAHLQLEHFKLIGPHVGNDLFPVLGLGQLWLDLFGFKGEFVIQKLIEKDLGNDFEFIAIVAKPVGGANGLEVINKLSGALFKLLRYHARTPARLPEANSFIYSATTSWLMVLAASGFRVIFCRF